MQWRSFEEFAVFGGSTSNLGLGGDKACDLFVLYVHLSIPGPEARDPNCGIRNGAAHLDRTRTRPQQWLFAEIQALRDSRGIHMCFLLDRYWICLFDLCEFIHDITRAVMLIWFSFCFYFNCFCLQFVCGFVFCIVLSILLFNKHSLSLEVFVFERSSWFSFKEMNCLHWLHWSCYRSRSP